MSKENETGNILSAIGLTEADIADAVAERILADFDVGERVASVVKARVEKEVERGLSARIEQTLLAEMERVLDAEIVPTNLWGESSGNPTTIRDQLADRARTFWNAVLQSAWNKRR